MNYNKSFKILSLFLPILVILSLLNGCGGGGSGDKVSDKAGITLSFDDRYIEEWYSIKDLLKRYNAKATFFVAYFEDLNTGEIRKLQELQADGHEIALHGRRHRNAIAYVAENSLQEYLNIEILPAIELMSQHGLTPASFSYPWGQNTEEIDNELLQYFDFVRDATVHDTACQWEDNDEYNNSIYWTGSRLICSRGIDGGGGLNRIYEELDTALETNTVLSLFTHNPTDKGGLNSIPISKIEAVLSYANKTGLKFYTISELGS